MRICLQRRQLDRRARFLGVHHGTQPDYEASSLCSKARIRCSPPQQLGNCARRALHWLRKKAVNQLHLVVLQRQEALAFSVVSFCLERQLISENTPMMLHATAARNAAEKLTRPRRGSPP